MHRYLTHLEQIHFVFAPTGKKDLLAVQFTQLGIKRSLLEYSCIHVCGEYERVGVSAIHISVRLYLRKTEGRPSDIPIQSNVIFASHVSKTTLARLVSTSDVHDLLPQFVP